MMRNFLTRLLRRPPAEPLCPELADLLEAYTQALEASTEAHLHYVQALNSGPKEAVGPALARVDQTEDALATAFERLKSHADQHHCG